MTYLIQRSSTHEYFYHGTWTLEAGWAEEFPNPEKAMAACLRHELRGVDLILQFGSEGGRKYQLQLLLPEQLLWPATYEPGLASDNFSSAASLLSP